MVIEGAMTGCVLTVNSDFDGLNPNLHEILMEKNKQKTKYTEGTPWEENSPTTRTKRDSRDDFKTFRYKSTEDTNS